MLLSHLPPRRRPDLSLTCLVLLKRQRLAVKHTGHANALNSAVSVVGAELRLPVAECPPSLPGTIPFRASQKTDRGETPSLRPRERTPGTPRDILGLAPGRAGAWGQAP
jgi:hypothetical protein